MLLKEDLSAVPQPHVVKRSTAVIVIWKRLATASEVRDSSAAFGTTIDAKHESY